MVFRTLILFITIFHFTIAIRCQETPFFVEGATWYYDGFTGVHNPELDDNYGLIILKYSRDTIIEGLKAAVIEESAYNNLGQVQYSYRPPLKWIMRQEGLKIMQYTDDGFQILYHFGAEKGDTIVSSLSGIFGFEYNPEYSFIIDSTSYFEHKGENLPEYYFHSNIPPYVGRVRYLIGYDRYLPVPNPLASDLFYAPSTIRCYENDITMMHFVEGPCDTFLISSALPEIQENHLNIYPNPAFTNVKISTRSTSIASIKIFDLNGQKVLEEKNYHPNNLIDIQKLQTGLYLIIIDESFSTPLKFVKL